MNATKDEAGYTVRANDKFRIRTTGFSSERFGPCEFCGKHMSEAFAIDHQVRYEDSELGSTFTYHEAIGVKFGHEKCLKGLVK